MATRMFGAPVQRNIDARLLRGEGKASFLMDHGRFGPPGLMGGEAGAVNEIEIGQGHACGHVLHGFYWWQTQAHFGMGNAKFHANGVVHFTADHLDSLRDGESGTQRVGHVAQAVNELFVEEQLTLGLHAFENNKRDKQAKQTCRHAHDQTT